MFNYTVQINTIKPEKYHKTGEITITIQQHVHNKINDEDPGKNRD